MKTIDEPGPAPALPLVLFGAVLLGILYFALTDKPETPPPSTPAAAPSEPTKPCKPFRP